MQNPKVREAIYDSEKAIHNDENFESRRNEELSALYHGDVFNIVIEAYNVGIVSLTDKMVLEYGCGFGGNIPGLVKRGATKVVGIDISDLRINEAKANIAALGLDNRVEVYVMNAEQMTFQNEHFDFIIGGAILHHLDIEKAAAELSRVLKHNGKALFYEPLGVNPLLNWYRSRTPQLRTPDEHPFVKHDFDIIRKYFNITYQKSFFLTSLCAYFFRFVIKNESLFWFSLRTLNSLDQILMRVFPPLHLLCWHTVIQLEKKS